MPLVAEHDGTVEVRDSRDRLVAKFNTAPDSAGIAAAFAAVPSYGSLAFLPGYSYIIPSLITITKPVTVDARGATFTPKAGVTGSFQVGTAAAPVSDFNWYGGNYDGTGGSAFAFAMSLFIKQNCLVDGLVFANTPADGIVLSGDGVTLSDVTTTAASTTVTSASAVFTADDVGKQVVIFGAGIGGGAFESRITVFTDANTVTVAQAVPKSTTLSRMIYATYQNAIFNRVRGTNIVGDGIRANANACGVTFYSPKLQNCSTGDAKGGFMSNGAPYVTVVNMDLDGVGPTSYGLRMLGFKNKLIVPRVRSFGTNDGIRLAEEGCSAIDVDVAGAPTNGYGVRVTNDSGLKTAPIAVRVSGSIRDCGGFKIDFVGPNGAAPRGVSTDLHVEGCNQDGFFITHGTFHRIRGTACNNGRDGVHVDNATDIDIDVNCYDNQASKTQVYAVRSTGTADRLKIRGKMRAADHLTGQFSLVGSNNDIGRDVDELARTGRGIVAETFYAAGVPGAGAVAGAIGVSNQVLGGIIGLHEGVPVTSLSAFCTAIGSGVTLMKFALCDSTGKVVAVTADLSASLVINTPLTGAIAGGPYIPTVEGSYYLVMLAIASVTIPSFYRAASATGIGTAIGSGLKPSVFIGAKTDMAVNDTYAFGANNTLFWLAAS